jgi:acetyl esterase/lipase
MLKYRLALLWIALLPYASSGQSFTSFDTIFTPAAYPDGALTGTLFVPSVPNGIAIVAVHGLGDAVSTMNGWSDTLAARGYTVLNIDYPDPVNAGATFPMPIRAIKTAVQFMRRSRGHFHLTTNVVGVVGRSLGAGLVAQSLIDEEDYFVYGIDNTISDHINFAALLYGLYDFTHFTQTDLPISISLFAQRYFGLNAALEARETPVLQSWRITTPLLLIHGMADARLQYQQTQEFHDSLAANGKSNDLILYPGKPHFFEAPSNGLSFTATGLLVKDSVLAFFSYQSGHAGVGDKPQTPAFAVDQNYPNPCGLSSASGSSATTMSFHLPRPATCSIVLQNVIGEIVRSSLPQFLEEGDHTTMIDVHGLPSGLYFCMLQSDAGAFARAIIVEN